MRTFCVRILLIAIQLHEYNLMNMNNVATKSAKRSAPDPSHALATLHARVNNAMKQSDQDESWR